MKKEKLNVGVIGLGKRGTGLLMFAKVHMDDINIAAV